MPRGLALPPPETQPAESDRTLPRKRLRGWEANRRKHPPQWGALPFCVWGKSCPDSFPKLQAPMGVPSQSEPCTGRTIPLPPRP